MRRKSDEPIEATEAMSSARDIISKWKLQLLPSSAYAVAYTAARASIGFAFESQRGAHSFDSDRRVDFWTRPNSLAFVPRGCDVTSESERGGEYLTFTVPAELLPDRGEQMRFNHAISADAIKAAFHLRKALLSAEPQDTLATEAQLYALLDVVEQVQAGAYEDPPSAASMTDTRLKRVEEFVEDHLARQMSMSDLAACVDLSAGFFNRAFKGATGKTPHDYVVERRMARARKLLGAPHSTLSQIAYTCGFSSHAHMSSTFKKRLGVTPTQLMTRQVYPAPARSTV
ncbi:HTH-type transcriptional activator Btr [Pseudovibrio sp. Ad13]|uniref:helix-turn-helix domain-containing protein n=1 Tax=Pseudovibrio sp. Ad13 TaxID=989396 RepID=UPI0007B1A655|nr:AraC family transcriptional regulator [Pseudovibrio sp. Ad13]KZK76014.1 HTH-type transcriptional activator Btr [Pseudovibrio sp. Ad13]